MTKQTIQIGLLSVLIYVAAIKFYNVLSTLFSWNNVLLFQIESEFTLIVINIVFGIIAALSLIVAARRILSKANFESKIIYQLTGVCISLFFALVVINKIYATILAESDFKELDKFYLLDQSWGQSIGGIFPLVALSYFLISLKSKVPNKSE
jgi:hypothetical protein